MTSKQLADLIAKLRKSTNNNVVEHVAPLTRDEANFVIELIEKNWNPDAVPPKD